MKNTAIVIIGILLIGFGIYLMIPNNADNTEVEDETTIEEEKYDKAPDFSLEDYDGNTVSMSDFSGKVSVINSWASWCPFCVKELDDFAKLQEEFADEIVVVAINRDESLSRAKKFTDELHVTGRMTLLLDPGDSFYRSIGAFSMPETIFVDGEGNIRLHKRGVIELDEMIEVVNGILES